MSNLDLINAWKYDNNSKLKHIADYKSIIEHINSDNFINSDKKEVVSYLKSIYDKLNDNDNNIITHNNKNIDIEYLADKVNSISMNIDKISNMLSVILDNDDKLNRTYNDFNKLFISFSGVGGEIRKAVRMLKARLGYDILTPTDKDRIYQTDEFRAILEECTGAGGSFDECMDTSLNKFLEERGLI